jgi:hypothetical protein
MIYFWFNKIKKTKKMELNSGESVYLERGAAYIKKSFGVFQGTMYITNNRIVFLQTFWSLKCTIRSFINAFN